ncbi:MAG: class I SAM-dependent DNA methyltransferase [Thermodesulfobacteriota bacterium]
MSTEIKAPKMTKNFREVANFIWTVADLLRDKYKRSKYQDVILPFTVLRRLDCVLEPTKEGVLKQYEKYKQKLDDPSGILRKASGYSFFNTSKYDFLKLLDDPSNIKQNLIDYLNGFSENVREIVDKFNLREEVNRLDEFDLLYKVVQRFTDPKIDLHPDSLTNHEMGYVFEELIRRFNEQSNENPGEHFTPREIIRLMVNVLMSKDKEELSKAAKIVTAYDPACGTGGMLTIAKEHILTHINPDATIELFGQESNPETFAVCKSDMLIKGENADNIKYGSSFSKDGLKASTFDYILSNPPYGKDWKQDEESIRDEHERGTAGRFSAGLPRISDGQLLFLQHMISKMHTNEELTRISIVFNGSPLFTGDAGSGESEIRRWIIENDWLEAIVALANQLFYNTGIHTYIWILTNKKEKKRKGKIALINATDMFVKMRKSLGDKRNEISEEQILEITDLYLDNLENGSVKIFDSSEFGYRKVTIERPLKLNFIASDEKIARLDEQKSFTNLAVSKKKDKQKKLFEEEQGKKEQERIKRVLYDMDEVLYQSYDEFIEVLDNSFKLVGIKLKDNIKKAIISALGERDENAEIIREKKGQPEPDPELRDYENVPLTEDIYQYFEREVKPHVPDAWINEKVRDEKDNQMGKVGYEINFNKYFYKYQPPRPLEQIDKDIKKLQKEILALLEEVTE